MNAHRCERVSLFIYTDTPDFCVSLGDLFVGTIPVHGLAIDAHATNAVHVQITTNIAYCSRQTRQAAPQAISRLSNQGIVSVKFSAENNRDYYM